MLWLLCLKMETQLNSERHASLKNWIMDKTEKRRLCQLISIMLCCLFWTSWLLKKGPICCPETPVMNCHSML